MKNKKELYPSKTTLNLVIDEKPVGYGRNMAIFAIVLVVLLAVFAKFAVIDRLAAESKAWAEVNTRQTQLNALYEKNTRYEEIRVQYQHYFASDKVAGSFVDCMDVLALIDAELTGSAGIRSISLNDNKLAVVLMGINLDSASDIVASIMQNDIVQSVDVASAATVDGIATSVSMTINFIAGGTD